MVTSLSPERTKIKPVVSWCRAYGDAPFAGQIKSQAEDFRVTEVLGFAADGEGEHDFLWIEKTNANTGWVARALARHAGVPLRDVGFCGQKDRLAVTRQWFSIRRPGDAEDIWKDFAAADFVILQRTRHRKKLKRGAHRGNQFRIVVRSAEIDLPAVSNRLQRVGEEGVPNYFGPQRFGFDGNNLALATALFDGRRFPREKRSMALSSARSFLFNEILQARIKNDTWTRVCDGDLLALDGSNSIFSASPVDDALLSRLRELDVHPTGALWGQGGLKGASETTALEESVVSGHGALRDGLEKAGLKMERRAMRTKVEDLVWEFGDGFVVLEFQLARGCFATSVLQEIVAAE